MAVVWAATSVYGNSVEQVGQQNAVDRAQG